MAIIRLPLFMFLLLAVSLAATAQESKPVRILVWDEQQPEQAKAYDAWVRELTVKGE